MAADGETPAELLALMRAGERTAFERFFERHASRLLIYVNYHLGERLRRKIEPDDILQEVQLKMFRDSESFCDLAERLGAQGALIRLADHAITEAYRYHFKVEKRDAKREITGAYLGGSAGARTAALAWVPSGDTSISRRLVRKEEYTRLMELLGALTPLEQFVMVSRVIEERSAADIAAMIGKSRAAVQMMLGRIRDKLRDRAGYRRDVDD